MSEHIKEIILGEINPPETRSPEWRTSKDWSREEIVELGQTVLRVLEQQEDVPAVLKHAHLMRLYAFGEAPHMSKQKHFKDMTELRREIGSERGADKGYFDNWTTGDFADYATRLSVKIGKRPGRKDYARATKTEDGPGVWVIEKRFGSIGGLNEWAGYPNIRVWSDDDFIAWGADVIRANDGRPFTYTMMEELSRRQRGPSEYPICRRFGKWTEFKRLATEEYERQSLEQAAEKAARLKRIQSLQSNGILPASTLNLPEAELLGYGARYDLATHLLTGFSDAQAKALKVSELSNDSFIRQIRLLDMRFTAAYIETEAVILGLFDTLWPPVIRNDVLKVA